MFALISITLVLAGVAIGWLARGLLRPEHVVVIEDPRGPSPLMERQRKEFSKTRRTSEAHISEARPYWNPNSRES